MKKTMAVLLLGSLSLIGCSPSTCEDQSSNFSLPPELKGYKVMRLTSNYGNQVYVIIPSKDTGSKDTSNLTEEKPTFVCRAPSKGVSASCMIINGKKYIPIDNASKVKINDQTYVEIENTKLEKGD